jgi:hypothetical protein
VLMACTTPWAVLAQAVTRSSYRYSRCKDALVLVCQRQRSTLPRRSGVSTAGHVYVQMLMSLGCGDSDGAYFGHLRSDLVGQGV